MDPTIIASILVRLLGVGLAASKALKIDGFGTEEIQLVQKLIEAGSGLLGLRVNDEPRLAARHLALVSRAFGEALRSQWYGDRRFAPGRGWSEWLQQDDVGRRRMRQIERCTRIAATQIIALGGRGNIDELTRLDGLLGDPLETPYYVKLYEAFSDNSLRERHEEPLVTDKLRFERDFRLAYAECLACGPGEELRRYLLGLAEDRAHVIRELLIRDLATWGSRHVFGNVAEHANLPPMPLGAMYVEPMSVHQEDGFELEKEPVLTALERLFPKHPIIIVQADFGHGKSLTARTLAWNMARAYLQDNKTSSEIFRPIFVKCTEDFESHSDELSKVLKRAEWRLARAIGLDISIEDPVFERPWPGRKLYLIDGLDEVALGDKEVKSLFSRLRENASSHSRYIIFTRPAILGRGDHLRGVPVLELQPFSIHKHGIPGGQVDDWLQRWCSMVNREPALTARDLDARGLLGVAATPILLFMIAFTWDVHEKERHSLTTIYESFFRQIARGKYEHDRDQNRPIADASLQLLTYLTDLGHLDSTAEPTEAMLWLMGRVAWKAKCIDDAEWLEGRTRHLRIYDVQKILKEELDVEGDMRIERTIQLGLLLALQADLEDGNPRILFGHQSFREFLVGRYWAERLRRLLRGGNRDWERRKDEPLLQGRFIGTEGASFNFFIEHVNMWPENERHLLGFWAEECINDERLAEGVISFRDDRRVMLREAALAIGSEVRPEGLQSKRQWTLRSLLAWFWIHNQSSVIHAPRLKATSAALAKSDMERANLANADLSGADLREANLRGANLRGANLSNAQMSGVDLSYATLQSAILSGANLSEANLNSSALSNARLDGTDLSGADLNSAELAGSVLHRAKLVYTRMNSANLEGVDMRGADLRGAYLCHAILASADIRDADLSGANLSGAELFGAELRGAILHGSNLRGARFHTAQFEGTSTEGMLLRDEGEEFAVEQEDD